MTILAALSILCIIIAASKLVNSDFKSRGNFKFDADNFNSVIIDEVDDGKKIEWDEITEKGVNEEQLLQNVKDENLEKIAELLQSLSTEIAQKEKEDINFYLSAGWFKYVLDSKQFNEVINMGNDAAKPLYMIIYKSPNQGSYEYICAMALSRIVDFDSESDPWSTSKDFLEKLNQKIIDNKEG